MKSIIETIAYTISARSRKKKFVQFLDLVAPKKNETIVDVGVDTQEYSTTDNYLEKFYSYPEHITAVGVEDMSGFAKRYPAVTGVQGDGRVLPFKDNEFDIAYSNAVIEHVGRFDDQLAFLKELYRVSRRGYITTPNRHFPVELHTRVPLLHLLLSKKRFDAVLKRIGKGWAAGDYMYLLSLHDLRALLKQAKITNYRIIKNRLWGFVMTFTVIWKKCNYSATEIVANR